MKKRKKLKITLIVIAAILLVIVVGGYAAIKYYTGGMKHVVLNVDDEALGISSDTADEKETSTAVKVEDVFQTETSAEGGTAAADTTEVETTVEETAETAEAEAIEATTTEAETTPAATTEATTAEAEATEEKTTEETTEEATEETTETTSAETTEAATTARQIYADDEIINFMIFGIDTVGYTAVDKNRSDTNMVVTIDKKNKAIKVTSILRDSKVPIEGHDPQKINAAYMYGGYILALKTFNQNFNLSIRDFVTIDFAELIELIDLIGGIDVEISEAEAEIINHSTADIAGDGRAKDSKAVEAGKAHLDGTQTLTFSRIRSIDSDYYRVGRQQVVLEAILKKARILPKTSYPDMIKSFLDTVETTFTLAQLLEIASLDLTNYKYVANTVPDAKYETDLWSGIDEHGEWVWIYDLEKAGERINKIIISPVEK